MSFETKTDPNSECHWLYKNNMSCWKVSFRLVHFYDTIVEEKLKKLFHPFQCRKGKKKNPVFYSEYVQPQVCCFNRRNYFWK